MCKEGVLLNGLPVPRVILPVADNQLFASRGALLPTGTSSSSLVWPSATGPWPFSPASSFAVSPSARAMISLNTTTLCFRSHFSFCPLRPPHLEDFSYCFQTRFKSFPLMLPFLEVPLLPCHLLGQVDCPLLSAPLDPLKPFVTVTADIYFVLHMWQTLYPVLYSLKFFLNVSF